MKSAYLVGLSVGVGVGIGLGIAYYLRSRGSGETFIRATAPIVNQTFVGGDYREIDRPKITEVARPRPKGILLPWEGTVTGEQTVYVRAKAFSLTLINDGPNPVYYFVNERKVAEDVAPVNMGEEAHADFDSPIIYKVILYCAPGNTAHVRLKLLR